MALNLAPTWAAKAGRRACLAAVAVAAWYVVYAHLEQLSALLTHHLLGLEPETHLASSVGFFLFEVPKVLMLLVLIVFVVGVIRTWFSPERTRRLLAGRREVTGNVLAAGLGVVTPFCSCSAVPLFLGFVESGVPLGVTFSFLIAAPMVNEVAVVLLLGLVGLRVTVLYVATGLLIAVVAGRIIGMLGLERHVEPWVYEVQAGSGGRADEALDWEFRLAAGRDAVRDVVGRIWPYVVGGIAVGAGIHGYVPQGALADLMGREAVWSVPAAVLLGVPLYASAAGIVPVVQALLAKGAALGTVLAFMMSVIALSLPELIILRRVLRPKLIAVFVGVVTMGIVAVGWLFNLIM